MKTKYELLKEELPEILDIVKLYPENLQEIVLKTLINELLEKKEIKPITDKLDKPNAPIPEISEISENEIPGIAYLNSSGEFKLNLRDLKANNKGDAVKRLVYVTIYAYMKLKKSETGVSRRNIIFNIIKDWRFNDGYDRVFLSKDKGLKKDGDLYSLDSHATREAEQFIKEILNDNITGNWKKSLDLTKKRSPKNAKNDNANKIFENVESNNGNSE